MNRDDVVTIIKAITPYVRIDRDAMIDALLARPITDLPDDLASKTENALLAMAWRDIEGGNAGVLPGWIHATITQITHKKSSSGNPTWYCILASENESVDGRTLYLGTTNGYAAEAKQVYPALAEMQIGDTVRGVAIDVYVTQPDGSHFLELQRIEPDGVFDYEYETEEDRKLRVVREQIYTIPDDALYLDVETTGVDAAAEIVQIATMDKSGNKFETYIKPDDAHKLTVPGRGGKSASDINGITPEMLKGYGDFPYFYNHNLKELLAGKTIVTYGDFDVRMLNQVCERHGLNPIDFQYIDLKQAIDEWNGEPSSRGGYKYVKLTDAYKMVIGDTLENAHDAMTDTEAMIEIVKALTKNTSAL